MMIWNTIRGFVSVELLRLAARIAPPQEQLSINIAIFEHLMRCIKRELGRQEVTTPKRPPPPDWTSKL